MAKENERPQFNPKHRIAGAIILVSLAVIFVPMFLDDSAPAKETRNLTEIPSRDTPVADTKVVVTPVPAPEADKPRVAAAEPVAEQTAAEAPAAPVAKAEPTKNETPKAEAPKAERRATSVAAVDKKTDTSAKAHPVAAKSSDAQEKVSKGWIVQVGTFSNTDNADRLREKLKSHGFAVSAEDVTVNGGKAVRLRVGPFRDKSSASNAQAQLQKELNLHGMVLAYP
jgi:DedD protein